MRAAASSTLTRTDALYFTVTVFSTVGFGDSQLRARERGSSSQGRWSPTSREMSQRSPFFRWCLIDSGLGWPFARRCLRGYAWRNFD